VEALPRFTAELEMPGEKPTSDKIFWEGRPIAQLMIRRFDWMALPVLLPGALMATTAVATSLRWFGETNFMLFDVVFVGASLFLFYLYVGRFFVEKYQLKHTKYVITSTHAQIYYKGVLRREIDLSSCGIVSFYLYTPDRGCIAFGKLTKFQVYMPYIPICWKRRAGPPRFENISHPDRVCSVLKKHHHVTVDCP
jgi:hypothetical protein